MPDTIRKPINYVQDMDHRGLPLEDYYLGYSNRRCARTAFSPFDEFPPHHKTEEEVFILETMDGYYSDAANGEDDYVKIGLWRIASCFIHIMMGPYYSTGPRIRDIIKNIMNVDEHQDDYGIVDMLIDTLGVDTDGYKHNPITVVSWIYAVFRLRIDEKEMRDGRTANDKKCKALEELVDRKFVEEESVASLTKRLEASEDRHKKRSREDAVKFDEERSKLAKRLEEKSDEFDKELAKRLKEKSDEFDEELAVVKFNVYRLENQVKDYEGRLKVSEGRLKFSEGRLKFSEGRLRDSERRRGDSEDGRLELLKDDEEHRNNKQHDADENRALSSRIRVLEGEKAQLQLSIDVMTSGRRLTRSSKNK